MRTKIDWNSAPPGARWWAIGELGQAYWFTPSDRYRLAEFWFACPAPTFDYEGDWQGSLTERPPANLRVPAVLMPQAETPSGCFRQILHADS